MVEGREEGFRDGRQRERTEDNGERAEGRKRRNYGRKI